MLLCRTRRFKFLLLKLMDNTEVLPNPSACGGTRIASSQCSVSQLIRMRFGSAFSKSVRSVHAMWVLLRIHVRWTSPLLVPVLTLGGFVYTDLLLEHLRGLGLWELADQNGPR